MFSRDTHQIALNLSLGRICAECHQLTTLEIAGWLYGVSISAALKQLLSQVENLMIKNLFFPPDMVHSMLSESFQRKIRPQDGTITTFLHYE